MKATMRRLVRADPDDRWAAIFGRIAAYSFLVALVSGILLLPFFRPSMAPVVYHGSYRKLDGLTMSRAYQSTLGICPIREAAGPLSRAPVMTRRVLTLFRDAHIRTQTTVQPGVSALVVDMRTAKVPLPVSLAMLEERRQTGTGWQP
jgi:hypothetical protein